MNLKGCRRPADPGPPSESVPGPQANSNCPRPPPSGKVMWEWRGGPAPARPGGQQRRPPGTGNTPTPTSGVGEGCRLSGAFGPPPRSGPSFPENARQPSLSTTP
eukprot:15218387-Alexandrium_andersonii.AAC.1